MIKEIKEEKKKFKKYHGKNPTFLILSPSGCAALLEEEGWDFDMEIPEELEGMTIALVAMDTPDFVLAYGSERFTRAEEAEDYLGGGY